MEVDVIEKDVPSSDGIHVLKGKLYIPQGEIKALFHVVHGMTEYIDRYDRFMKSVAAEGFLVFGYDNLGHGKTAVRKRKSGFYRAQKGLGLSRARRFYLCRRSEKRLSRA